MRETWNVDIEFAWVGAGNGYGDGLGEQAAEKTHNKLIGIWRVHQCHAIAGRNAAACPAPVRTERHVPFSIIFTEPPIVSIGKAEADGAVSGYTDYGNQGRARVEARDAHIRLSCFAFWIKPTSSSRSSRPRALASASSSTSSRLIDAV